MDNSIILRRSVAENKWNNQIHPILERIYAGRGINVLEAVSKDLTSLYSYHALLNIDTAVQLLTKALKEQQKIIIIGDFDADGATSTALAVRALRAFGASKEHVHYLVPNRFEYGYGLSPEIVNKAALKKPNLIVTVDNGISSVEGVERAHQLGISVLITDHHLPGEKIPQAESIINPNQVGDRFLGKNLAGVGVIFYVMLALRAHLREINWFENNNLKEPNMLQFLDLVALGTVADLVPLDQNNRILVHWGIERIRSGKACFGIQALLTVAKRKINQASASDLGFAAGPRLNAAGRLEDMSIGIACLLADEAQEAEKLAQQLDQLNKERQFIEKDMHEQAIKVLDRMNLANNADIGVCLYDPLWHQGVIGILAARIKERVNRPVIVFTKVSDTEVKGSARSIPGLHIRDLLDKIAVRYPGVISKFGGHAMAAGLSLELKQYEVFRKAFNEVAKEVIDPQLLCGKIWTDGELTPVEFTLDLALLIQNAGPWGQNFPEPLFDNVFYLIDQRLIGNNYLKMLLKIPETDKYLDAIAFKIEATQWPDYSCQKVHVVYRLDVNEYQGLRKLQLIVEHIGKLR